jgi:hypothetical protein
VGFFFFTYVVVVVESLASPRAACNPARLTLCCNLRVVTHAPPPRYVTNSIRTYVRSASRRFYLSTRHSHSYLLSYSTISLCSCLVVASVDKADIYTCVFKTCKHITARISVQCIIHVRSMSLASRERENSRHDPRCPSILPLA